MLSAVKFTSPPCNSNNCFKLDISGNRLFNISIYSFSVSVVVKIFVLLLFLLLLFDTSSNPGGGDFNFATSNEMWRASLDILDFMPLTSADYGGGLIITDWYSDQGNSNDSIKISIRFLSNEIRADALKIKVFSKQCEITANCKVFQSNPKIENELKVAILKKAAKYKKDIVDSNPKRPLNTILGPGDKN